MKKVLFKLSFAFIAGLAIATALSSCSGNGKNEKKAEVSEEDFYATQPCVSGQYEASYFEIKGKNSRKGPFDGRIMMALDPESCGIYVYENGNRVKINYRLVADKPFEKQADGVFLTADKSGNPISVTNDSTSNILSFVNKGDTVAITYNPVPASTATAAEMWQRISNAINNK